MRLSTVADPKSREELTRELAAMRNFVSTMTKLSALLEVLIVRVETLSTLGATLKDIMVVKAIVKDLRSYASVVPELSIIVEDVEDKVNDLLHSSRGEYQSLNISEAVVNEEVKKIVEEANAIAASKLSNVK